MHNMVTCCTDSLTDLLTHLHLTHAHAQFSGTWRALSIAEFRKKWQDRAATNNFSFVLSFRYYCLLLCENYFCCMASIVVCNRRVIICRTIELSRTMISYSQATSLRRNHARAMHQIVINALFQGTLASIVISVVFYSAPIIVLVTVQGLMFMQTTKLRNLLPPFIPPVLSQNDTADSIAQTISF